MDQLRGSLDSTHDVAVRGVEEGAADDEPADAGQREGRTPRRVGLVRAAGGVAES